MHKLLGSPRWTHRQPHTNQTNWVRDRRWWIAGFLAFATALSYLDRQNFPVAVTEIEKHIALTDKQYSQLQMLFLLSYAVMYAGGGKLADWLGTRKSYAIMILWWSTANIAHGLVSGVSGLAIARLSLGLGEGGGFPCSAKAVSEWFRPEERAFAFGIFNMGSSIGAVLAPPLIAIIVLALNWRWVFFLTGALGFLWALSWWLFYPSSKKTSFTSPVGKMNDVPQNRISWFELFKYRQVWGLLTAKFLTDSAWFFFIFWLPKYLGDVRHLNIKQMGYYAWIPYAFAGAGSFIGGWLSGFLIRRNLMVGASRKVCMGLSAAMMPVSLLISTSPLGMAIAFFSMALFGHQFWSTILQTLPSDMFPSTVVGSVSGLMGAVGSFGAMLFNLLVGSMLTHYHSYSLMFMITGLLHPLSFIVVLMFIPKVEPLGCQTPYLAAPNMIR